MKTQPESQKPKDMYGESSPVAGLLTLAAALPPDADQAAELLRELRAGKYDADAVTIPWGKRDRLRLDGSKRAELTYYPEIVNAFLPLLALAIRNPAYGQADPRGWHDDRLGYLFERLVIAVDRLRMNRKPDAIKEIEREMYRGRLGYYREVSLDIRPPASTNSTRKKHGKPPHPPLKRVNEIDRKGRYIDPLEDDETLVEAGMITLPAEIDETEAIVAETPLEGSTIGMVLAGMSEREIAASLGISRHQVRRTLAVLRLRARRAA